MSPEMNCTEKVGALAHDGAWGCENNVLHVDLDVGAALIHVEPRVEHELPSNSYTLARMATAHNIALSRRHRIVRHRNKISRPSYP